MSQIFLPLYKRGFFSNKEYLCDYYMYRKLYVCVNNIFMFKMVYKIDIENGIKLILDVELWIPINCIEATVTRRLTIKVFHLTMDQLITNIGQIFTVC